MPFPRRSFLALLGALPLSRLRAAPGKRPAYVPSFLHPNDRWVVLRGDNDFLHEIVDLETGTCVQRLRSSQQSTYYGSPTCCFDPGGRFLLMAVENAYEAGFKTWDLEAPGTEPRPANGEQGTQGAFKDEPPSSWEAGLPRFTLPEPGGILRLPQSDWDLKTFSCVRRRTKALPLRSLLARVGESPDFAAGRITWKLATVARERTRLASSEGGALTVACQPMMWQPAEGGDVLLARRAAGTVLVKSGYCTVREIDAANGAVKRILAAAMPQTGLLAFGSSRNVLYAARPLDVAVRWNRLGKSTQQKGGISDWITRPPIQELGVAKALPGSGPEWPRGTRVLAQAGGKLAVGRDSGEVWLGGLQDRQGGPWKLLGRQEDAVRALAFVPGQPLLVSGGRTGTVSLWDLAGGSLKQRLAGHSVRVNAAVATGDMAVTAGPDGIRLWGLPDGILLRHIPTEGVWVSDLALDPGGTLLAAALLDGTVRVIDLKDGARTWQASPGAGWCAAVAWDPRGELVASGHELGDLCFWKALDGSPAGRRQVMAETQWQQGTRPIHALAWSPDGQVLAAGLGDAVRVYDRTLNSAKGEGWTLPLDWADEYT